MSEEENMGRPTNAQVDERKRAAAEELQKTVMAAVAAALQAERTKIREELRAEFAHAAVAETPSLDLTKPHSPEGDKGFAASLALAIANLSAQGTNKAPFVPPDVIEGWTLARERMMALIIAARARYGETQDEGDLPRYRLTKTQYLNEMRIEPQYVNTVTHTVDDQVITWDEAPNEAMEPVNDVARAIYAAFCESIGATVLKEKPEDRSFARTAKGNIMGVRGQSNAPADGFGAPMRDPRVRPDKAGTVKHVNVLGTVAAPAALR